jgi:hypothetical protein
MLWLFSIYLGSFEAVFFMRADAPWFVLGLAVCGLRMLRFTRVQA